MHKLHFLIAVTTLRRSHRIVLYCWLKLGVNFTNRNCQWKPDIQFSETLYSNELLHAMFLSILDKCNSTIKVWLQSVKAANCGSLCVTNQPSSPWEWEYALWQSTMTPRQRPNHQWTKWKGDNQHQWIQTVYRSHSIAKLIFYAEGLTPEGAVFLFSAYNQFTFSVLCGIPYSVQRVFALIKYPPLPLPPHTLTLETRQTWMWSPLSGICYMSAW